MARSNTITSVCKVAARIKELDIGIIHLLGGGDGKRFIDQLAYNVQTGVDTGGDPSGGDGIAVVNRAHAAHQLDLGKLFGQQGEDALMCCCSKGGVELAIFIFDVGLFALATF